MKFIVLAILLTVALSAGPKHYELENYDFKQYIRDFERSYENAEEHFSRAQIFDANLKEIKEHNANPEFTWKKGVN